MINCVIEIVEITISEEHDYDFLRYKNYHCLAVTNPSALLMNFFSKQNSNKFCLNWF